MPYKSGKLKGQLTTPELRKLIKAHNILMSIKIPPGTDRDGILKIIKDNGFKVDHEKQELISPTVLRRKPTITLSQAKALTKPKPKTALQKQKAIEVKQAKAQQKKKEIREIKKQAIAQQKQIQKKIQKKPEPVKKPVKKPEPVKKPVKKQPVKKPVTKKDIKENPFIGKSEIKYKSKKNIPKPPPVSKPSKMKVKVKTGSKPEPGKVGDDIECGMILKLITFGNKLLKLDKKAGIVKLLRGLDSSFIYSVDHLIEWEENGGEKYSKMKANEFKPDVIKKAVKEYNDYVLGVMDISTTKDYTKQFNRLKNRCGEQEAQKLKKLYDKVLLNNKQLIIVNKALSKKEQIEAPNLLTGGTKQEIEVQADADYGDVKVMSVGEVFKNTLEGKSIEGVYPWATRRDVVNLLMYGWILNESKNDCSVPYSVMLKTRLYNPNQYEFTKSYWFNTSKMLEDDIPKEIAKSIIRCAKRKKIVAMPLSGIHKQKGGHANMLIWNYHLNTLERYEPHGEWGSFGINDWNVPEVNEAVNKELKELGSNFQFKYLSPKDVCPRPGLYKEWSKNNQALYTGKNLQAWETSNVKGSKNFEGVMIKDPSGYCGAFSFLFLWTRLKNPLVPVSGLLAEQLKYLAKQSQDGKPEDDIITQMIRGFTKVLFEASMELLKDNILTRAQLTTWLEKGSSKVDNSGMVELKVREKVMEIFTELSK